MSHAPVMFHDCTNPRELNKGHNIVVTIDVVKPYDRQCMTYGTTTELVPSVIKQK
jgi:hypothetical protein